MADNHSIEGAWRSYSDRGGFPTLAGDMEVTFTKDGKDQWSGTSADGSTQVTLRQEDRTFAGEWRALEPDDHEHWGYRGKELGGAVLLLLSKPGTALTGQCLYIIGECVRNNRWALSRIPLKED